MNEEDKYKFDFHWNEEDIWNLSYPMEELDIRELTWHLYYPFWNNYTLRPIDVINNKDLYTEEYNRIINSDLSYPIDIMGNYDRWVILDGLHRLSKYYILNERKVQVRRIPRSEISRIARKTLDRRQNNIV